MAGPCYDEETVLYADLDLEEIVQAKAIVDSVGHYARWEVLSLNLNVAKYVPVHVQGGEGDARSTKPHLDEPAVRELEQAAWRQDAGTRELIGELLDRIEHAPPRLSEENPSQRSSRLEGAA